MSTEPTAERPTYTLGAQEERLFAGLGLLELVGLAVLGSASLIVLRTHTSLGGIAVALMLLIAGVVIAWFPVAGRSTMQWLLVLTRWIVVRARSLHRWHREPETVVRRGRLDQLIDLPGELGRLELWEAQDARGTGVGVVRDKVANTYCATVLVRGSVNWTLEGEDRQGEIAGSYGSMLVRMAKDRSAISRISYVERTLPEAPGALIRDFFENRAPGVSFDDARTRSYLELLEGAGRQADQHEVLMTVQIRGAAARRQARRRKWDTKEAPFLVLMEELATFAAQLGEAELEVRMALSADAYLAALRTGLDPWGSSAIEQTFSDGAGEPDEARMAPLARREHWNRVVIDGSQHATLWVESWPGTRVGPGFLDPLLVDTDGAVRSAAVVMELRGPRAGRRRAEHDVTVAEGAAMTRDSIGKRTSSRQRKLQDSRYAHEDEIADGHADTRFVGFVVVSAPGDDPAVLEAEVDRVSMQAAKCGLRLERLYGAQASAVTFGLPLARGLR